MNAELIEIQEMCIRKAKDILNENTALTGEAAKTVSVMMDAALDVEELNFRQEFQNRYGAAAFRGRSSVRTAGCAQQFYSSNTKGERS